ncbi:sensor histidine kinase [Halioxenophilus sp. WMMB6]|uniref:sensor histidine kinase n=1 Tax=Halioxenophilus sp. WMMB6 TaxID=3073815 RepID=UPI00295E95F2|nr:ATP-binding protein [Halioxenophilus sp. WMMB6]
MNPPQAQSPRILVTDDSPVNQLLIQSILSPIYSQVIQAENGASCLATMSEQNIDLLLLDMNMPEISGMDVLKQIPKLPRNRQPRVLVVSSDNRPDTVAAAFQQGADDYLTTPFSREELLARVQTQLALRRRAQYLEELVTSRTRELSETNQRLKQTHHQLMQAEKMASLGQLSAGIAHEINNPIAYINSNLQTLALYCSDFAQLFSAFVQLPDDLADSKAWLDARQQLQKQDYNFLVDDAKQLVAESLTGVERVTQIINDLKVFSHPEQNAWQPGDINACIVSALNIAGNQLKYKARVTKNFSMLPMVECVMPQINQVLVNLLVNAAQAIEEYGDITITTEQTNANEITITITDSGSGIPKSVLDRIYDPFFTTKPVGEGTGLGLAVSYGIIQNHQGTITANSKKGEGTTFTITLPIHHLQPSDADRLSLRPE